jgi:hypothetical protein
VQRFEKKKQDLNLPDDYGVGDVDSGVNSHAAPTLKNIEE